MAYHYSNPERAGDPGALPDVETFWHDCTNSALACPLGYCDQCAGFECNGVGWYWQSCFPGCLPDGDPCGPFATEQEAIDDAREGNEDDGDEGDES